MFLPQWLRQLAHRWSFHGGKGRRRAGRVAAPTLRRVWPTLEVLENRLCPSVLNYTVVAQTGTNASTVYNPNGSTAGTLTNVALASINDSGSVAFLGTLNSGYSGVDEAALNADGSLKSLSVLSFTNRNFTFPQIDNNGDVIAQDQYLTGSTLNSYIRTWQTNGTYGSGPDAQGSLDGSTGDGDIVLHPSISPDGTQVAYQDESSGQLSLYINGDPVHTFPAGSAGLYEEIANNGAVVVQDGTASTSPIMIFQDGQTPVTIASTAMGFTTLGSEPGISPDGQVVVFYGKLIDGAYLNTKQAGDNVPSLMPGEGIFASVNTTSHGRVILRIAGDDSTTWLNPGETFQDNDVDGIFSATNDTKLYGVSTFDPNSPVAVNSAGSSGVTIVYMAKDDNGNDGVYANRLDFLPSSGTSLNPQDPGSFRDNIDTKICSVGDAITDLGTVQSLKIYDPINSQNQIAFIVTYNNGDYAVVRDDTFVPILWVPPESQGNQDWASDPYAGGGPMSGGGNYTIKNNGCTLTDLSMALNYASISTDPGELNTLLTNATGYNGHSVLLGYDTTIAANNAWLTTGYLNNVKFNNYATSDPDVLAAELRKTDAPWIVAVPVVVNGKTHNHYVLVTGMIGDVFAINDPGDLADHTLNPGGGTKYTTFVTRGYISDPTDQSGLEVSAVGAGSGVEISVTNPQGQTTGFNPANGQEENQIPGSVEYTDGLESDAADDTVPAESNNVVAIATPQAGTYTISVTSLTSTEPFTLSVGGVASDGSVEPIVVDTGTAAPGSPVTFTTTYSPLALVSLSDSTIAVTPGTIAVGDTATVTLTAKDAAGNQEKSGGLTVAFGLGSGSGSGTFGPVKDNGDGTYTATFTGTTAGTNTISATINGQAVTSTAPTVTVAVAPVVTVNPTSQIATAGDSVSFVAAAVGSPAPTVQWQVSTDSGNTFTNIAGATSTTLTLTPTSDDNDNEYRAVFTNSNGSATTTPATLTVNAQPSGLVISSSTGVFPQFNLADTSAGSSYFGTQVVPLSTGNIVVNGGGSAVYLYNGQTGALISTLTGGDSMEIFALTNGNFVVADTDWDNGVGAVTWGSGITGVSGPISAANSLIGTTQGKLQDFAITPLANGNYVVSNAGWHYGVGAVTWGNGTTGTTGIVSAANSLVGSTISDQVGSRAGNDDGVYALANGNYIVDSSDWNSGAGAVTWANGTSGITGTISAANSLVGTVFPDSRSSDVGDGGVTALTNGNYVVDSSSWNGVQGAVTWGNGTTGITGVVSAANSLVGNPYDSVGSGGITALTNGNYVVASPDWHNSQNVGEGAATWGNGTTGIIGTISAANSLVGNVSPNVWSYVSEGGITALANGNYVVDSPRWNGGLGAVTWGNGATGTTGDVSASNSLVGSNVHDEVGGPLGNTTNSGGVVALTNGNYVVYSPNWNGANGGEGAVTWGNGATGISGTVSASNSLVGSNPNDHVAGGFNSIRGVTALTNGNYVVASPSWNFDEGAATWGNGTTGIVGAVSTANSLVGTYPSNDQMGNYGVAALANGNYVVLSSSVTGLGSVATWGDGTVGTTGTVSASNSLTNLPADTVNGSFYVTALPDGNYLVSGYAGFSSAFTTWGDGTTGTTLDGQGTAESQNSLLGVSAAAYFASSGSSVFLSSDAYSSTLTTGFTDPNQLTYTFGEGQMFNVTPDFITRALNAGINVTLQSNNDITINSPIIENPTVTPGSLTLEAGRSIILNASINTAGGNLTLIANDSKADGVVDSERDPGNAIIAEQSGAAIDTGTGTLTVDLKNGTDKTNNGAGAVTLPNVTASSETLSSASTVGITINGTTPGDGVTAGTYTQLNVSGAINLNGAPLAITHSAATPQGATFIIVQSSAGVTGTFNGLSEGAIVTASDGIQFSISYLGNGGKDVVLTQLTAAPQAPAFTSAASTTFTVGSDGSFTVTASGSPAPTLSESSSDILPRGTTFNAAAGVLSGTPAVGASGIYTLHFTATNSSGSVGQTFTLTVNQAPAITSGNSVTFAAGQSGSFTVTATGSPTPSLSESGTLPSGVTFVDHGNGTATLGGTAAAGTNGTYAISITAHNGVGSDFTQSFTLTVSQSQAPTITSANSATFTAGHGGSFNVTATGSPTPALRETGTLPSGITFTDNGNGTATLSGAPAVGSAGIYTLQFTANSNAGSVVQTFSLTVNQAPSIASGNSATFTVTQSGSFLVTSTGAPTATLTESGALPSGVTFTDNGNGTATLGGIPAAGTQGTYHFTIAANNGVGSDFTQNFTLTVNTSPPPPPPPSTQPPTHSAPPVLHAPPLVAFFDSLLGAIETINANGTETVTDNFLGIPLVVAIYDNSGNFVSATLLGLSLPNWVWNL